MFWVNWPYRCLHVRNDAITKLRHDDVSPPQTVLCYLKGLGSEEVSVELWMEEDEKQTQHSTEVKGHVGGRM